MNKIMKLVFVFVAMVMFIGTIMFASAIQDNSIMANIRVTDSGFAGIENSDINILFYDNATNGNLIYNETFVNATDSNGYFTGFNLIENSDVNITQGETYYLDMNVDGTDQDWQGSERLPFNAWFGQKSEIKEISVDVDSGEGVFNFKSLGTTIWSMVKDVSNKLQIRYQSSPVMTFLTNGNVGIGTDAPASKLDVNGKISATDWTDVSITESQVSDLGNYQTKDVSGNVDVTGNLTVNGGFGSTGTSIYNGNIYTASDLFIGGQILSVDSQSVNGSIIPQSDSVYTLGNSTNKFSNTYTDSLTLNTGLSATDISGDGNLTDASNSSIPTEYAVKSYVDNNAGGGMWTLVETKTLTGLSGDDNVLFTFSENKTNLKIVINVGTSSSLTDNLLMRINSLSGANYRYTYDAGSQVAQQTGATEIRLTNLFARDRQFSGEYSVNSIKQYSSGNYIYSISGYGNQVNTVGNVMTRASYDAEQSGEISSIQIFVDNTGIDMQGIMSVYELVTE